MAEDYRIRNLRVYRAQLVNARSKVSQLASTLGEAWMVDGSPNGVSTYLKTVYSELTTAISRLDTDIANLKNLTAGQ